MFETRNLRALDFGPYDFSLEPGECLVISGPSGSGKSVLLRALADLSESDGQVLLDGSDRIAMSGPEWRQNVRYLAAEPGWWAETPVEHFHDSGWLRENLAALGLEKSLEDRSISQLSTGERQRMALLRALEDTPAVLLADEPTAALDDDSIEKAEKLLRKYLDGGGILILVTHSNKQAKAFATKRIKLERKPEHEGAP